MPCRRAKMRGEKSWLSRLNRGCGRVSQPQAESSTGKAWLGNRLGGRFARGSRGRRRRVRRHVVLVGAVVDGVAAESGLDVVHACCRGNAAEPRVAATKRDGGRLRRRTVAVGGNRSCRLRQSRGGRRIVRVRVGVLANQSISDRGPTAR